MLFDNRSYVRVAPFIPKDICLHEELDREKFNERTGAQYKLDVFGSGHLPTHSGSVFCVIARALGAQQYGVFVASTAFPMILSPFVGFGGGNLLIKNVAHDRTSFPVYWGNWLFMTLASGLTFIAFVIFFARLVLPATIPLLVIVSVSLAELIFIRLVECAAMAFQAVGRLDVTAQLHIWSALAKLVGIAVLAVNIHHPTAQQWSFVYLITTVIGTVLGLYWVQTRIDKPRLELCRIKGEFIEGL